MTLPRERKRTLNNRPPPFPEDFGERLERSEGVVRAVVGASSLSVSA